MCMPYSSYVQKVRGLMQCGPALYLSAVHRDENSVLAAFLAHPEELSYGWCIRLVYATTAHKGVFARKTQLRRMSIYRKIAVFLDNIQHAHP